MGAFLCQSTRVVPGKVVVIIVEWNTTIFVDRVATKNSREEIPVHLGSIEA